MQAACEETREPTPCCGLYGHSWTGKGDEVYVARGGEAGQEHQARRSAVMDIHHQLVDQVFIICSTQNVAQ
jgi:hypothetical protein